MTNTLKIWHTFVKSPAAELLDGILTDDCIFHSPFVWKPKVGKAMTAHILMTVTGVFEDFRYVREIVGDCNACLEFEARVGDLTLRGVDLITFGDDGKIVDFEVMIRPANALIQLGEEMGRRLG
jgi:hypothetical protein